MKKGPIYGLYDRNGQRKYLSSEERGRFFKIANTRIIHKRLFLLMLFYSGARISEVLNLCDIHIDATEDIVVLECLKKRRKGVYRAVPLPAVFVTLLMEYIQNRNKEGKIWKYSRRTASRYVKSAMDEAGIDGVQASAKGLRHGFAVSAIEKNVPLNLIKNWMGHSSISTTEIYLHVSGKEERGFAKRMW